MIDSINDPGDSSEHPQDRRQRTIAGVQRGSSATGDHKISYPSLQLIKLLNVSRADRRRHTVGGSLFGVLHKVGIGGVDGDVALNEVVAGWIRFGGLVRSPWPAR